MAMAATTTAATANTMSTDEPSAAPRPLLAGLAALAAGLLVAGLALPRVAAYGVALSDGAAVSIALAEGRGLPADALSDARRRHAQALSLHGDAQLALDLARFDLRAADAGNGEALAAAHAHLREAASRSPNDAFIWSQLAHVAQLRGAPIDETAAYLRLSRLTGRFEAPAMLLRVRTALPLWSELPEDIRGGVAADMARLGGDPRLRKVLYAPYLSLGLAGRAIFLENAFETEGQRSRFRSQIRKYAGERRS